jgi:hypothetical protein
MLHSLEGPDNRAGKSSLVGRKSVLMGLAASMGVALVNAAQPSSAMAAGTVKPVAATTPIYAPKWTPSTSYALGQQIISPNNDVVTAKAAHRSSTTFTPDQAKWTLSSTFVIRAEFTELAAAVAALQAVIGTAPTGGGGGGGGGTMYNSAIYGSGVGFDCKGNVVIYSGESMAVRFKAGTSSTLTGVQWTQRMGSTGYSSGTGGTTTVSIQSDDGSGKPSGTKLATTSWAGGNNAAGEERRDISTFSSPASLTAGTIYYLVFENASASNYISVNCGYIYSGGVASAVRSLAPKHPKFSDSEFGVLLTTAYGGAWSTTVNNANGYTAVVDLIYANGYHDGNAYYENMTPAGHPGMVSGTASMVRETFTVTGGNRTVNRAGVRVRRHSGTAPLVLTLETAAGVYIDSGTIPAANIQIPPDMAYSLSGGGGAVWVTANFAAARTLTNGVAYNLRLSTATGTTYSTDPIRNATENYYGFKSYDFTDGVPYKTVDGSTWTRLAASPYTSENFDLQFYLS